MRDFLVLFGSGGNGKSSIANLAISRKKKIPPFPVNDTAGTSTLKMAHRTSVLPNMIVWDTPGSDLWTDDDLKESLQELREGMCRLCFVMSPVTGGRMRAEDVWAIKRVMLAIEAKKYYVVVNFAPTNDEEAYQAQFVQLMNKSCESAPAIDPPAGILFLPVTQDLQAHSEQFLEFVKEMEPQLIGRITAPKWPTQAEREQLAKTYHEFLDRKSQGLSSKEAKEAKNRPHPTVPPAAPTPTTAVPTPTTAVPTPTTAVPPPPAPYSCSIQ